ncbi:hypothetical protein V1517DRAFT_311889 [Lipomyces orientalis]|uniref:Uncharacterized protein n=1 Tax=Lipomyces orientalis TaxID=1233043 RepID=A0ACC3U0X0_9ASCO
MAGNYVAAYGPDRAGPGPTAAMYIPQQHIPAAPLQYQHQQHAMATIPPPPPPQSMQPVQLPDQHQQQHQPQQPQRSQHYEQQQQQLFSLQKQQYLEQQYAHDPLTAAFFAADPSVPPEMISNIGTLNSNDYNHNYNYNANNNNSNNSVVLDLLANDLASSISANPTADFVLCPPSPNHPPPDFSRVQRISEQYMRTGDAPYIASAALFQGGWDGLEGWKQLPPSQTSQQSSMVRASLTPASQAYIQPGASLNPRQVPLNALPSASVPMGTQQPRPVPLSQQNDYWKPPQQQPIQRPSQSQFQQSPPPMLQQQLDRLQSLPQQPMQRHPSPSQQLPRQSNVPDNSFEFSQINWSDLQSNILNASPGSASPVQASGLALGTGHPPINQFPRSEVPVMPQTWGASPVPSTHSMDYAISAHSSPSTPGRVFHPHRRAVSFPVHANIPASAQSTTSPFLAYRSTTQRGPRTTESASTASQALYSMQQPFGGLHVREEVEQSVAAISHSQQDVREGDADILEFERRLNVLSQSTIDQGQSPAAPTPRPDMPSRADAGPSVKLDREKSSIKRKDTKPVVSGGGPKKTKEQIQAEKAAAKEEKARAKAEKQKLQREKAEQKKRDQAMRRAQEEQAMKEIREKLAREEQENECTRGAGDQIRAEESDKKRKIDSSPGGNYVKNGAAGTVVGAGEVSLYPDTQAEFLFAQRELLTDAFVPRVPPKPVNTPQGDLPAIGANAQSVPTGTSAGYFATQPTQTQTPASLSPFVYHVKRAPSLPNTPSTAYSAAPDKSKPALNVARGPSPQSSLLNTGPTRAEDHEKDMIVQKTPAPTQAKIVQSTAKMEKSLQKPAVARTSLKKQASNKSKVESISPKPPQSHSQSFSGASQPMAQPSSEFKFSSPPEATSTPANYRTTNNKNNMPNPVIFAGQNDTQSHLLSRRSSPATDPVISKSPPDGLPQTKRPFMSLNNVDSVSEDTEKENNDFVSKMGMDLEEIFGLGVGVGVGPGGASVATEPTFQDAQQPLALVSSPYGIGNGMTADEDKVLGDVLGKVEEWSKSLQWNIGEEAMRLGGISSNSSGSES